MAAGDFLDPDDVFTPDVTEYATIDGESVRCSAIMQVWQYREFDDVAINDIRFALRFAVEDFDTILAVDDVLTFRGEVLRVLGKPRSDQLNVFFKVAIGDKYARK